MLWTSSFYRLLPVTDYGVERLIRHAKKFPQAKNVPALKVSRRRTLPRPKDWETEDRNTREHKAPKDEVRDDQGALTVVYFLYDLFRCIVILEGSFARSNFWAFETRTAVAETTWSVTLCMINSRSIEATRSNIS